MRFHTLHLQADVGFEVIEAIEVRRFGGGGSHLFRQARLQFVFPHLQQAAVGVVDDDELLGVEQVMRDDQRAQSVVGSDAAGVANHVRVAGMQAQAMLEQDARVHAGQHGDMPPGADREISQREITREIFVGLQQLIGDGQ